MRAPLAFPGGFFFTDDERCYFVVCLFSCFPLCRGLAVRHLLVLVSPPGLDGPISFKRVHV